MRIRSLVAPVGLALGKLGDWLCRGTGAVQLAMIRRVRPDESVDDRLAEGYSYVPYSPEVEAAWIELLNASGEFPGMGVWSKTVLHQTIVDHLLPGGAVLVQCKGELVACSSVCHFKNRGQEATLMYVLTTKAHRKQRLGWSMTQRAINATHQAKLGAIRLLTDDTRIGAVRLYLQCGFVPEIQPDDRQMARRWSEIFRKIATP